MQPNWGECSETALRPLIRAQITVAETSAQVRLPQPRDWGSPVVTPTHDRYSSVFCTSHPPALLSALVFLQAVSTGMHLCWVENLEMWPGYLNLLSCALPPRTPNSLNVALATCLTLAASWDWGGVTNKVVQDIHVPYPSQEKCLSHCIRHCRKQLWCWLQTEWQGSIYVDPTLSWDPE